MEDIPDLWPNEVVETEATLTPYTILKRQAEALAPRTNGIVEAKVARRTDDEDDFVYSFRLVAPTLQYSYELFTAWHQPVKLYPVYCVFLNHKTDCETQDQLLDWLKFVLSSKETKRVLNGLLVQAKEGISVE